MANDLLYLILAACCLVLTIVITIVCVQAMRVLDKVNKVSGDIEQITTLVEKIAQVVFPGMERVAKRADRFEQKVADFVEDKFDEITKRRPWTKKK